MQTINTLILVFGTFISVYSGIHLADIQKQKMPEHTTPCLDQFARMAVQKAEQTSLGISPEAKRSLAQADIISLHNDYKLPVPSQRAINIAIESAVFLLPKSNR